MDLNRLTLIVKTFLRPRSLEALVKSVRAVYPRVVILVADDGNVEAAKDGIDGYFNLPFDTGLSYGRNFLLEKVSTDYIMVLDDDSLFTETTRIEYPLFVLEHTSFDLVAGICHPNRFWGLQTKEEGKLIRDLHLCRNVSEGYPVYDFVPNFFLARTDKIRAINWDPELKLQEHMDFFWRARGKLRCTLLPYFSAINCRDRNEEYERYRGRTGYFQALQCKKLGVEKIVDRKNNPNFKPEDLCPEAKAPPRL